MKKTLYVDLRKQTCTSDINLLFQGWEKGKERVAVFGAHDDDLLIGAGYAMAAVMQNDAVVYGAIFCKGDCGYSSPDQKDTIVDIRRAENEKALARFGVENLARFEYPDFSLGNFRGKEMASGESGTFLQIVDYIRKNRITRVLIPNGHREHFDHSALYEMAMYDVVQAGDAVVSDRGSLQKVKTTLQYSVWADFSPEDALVSGETDYSIRANRAILCADDVERRVSDALLEYASQARIIRELVESRQERRVGEYYMEPYIDLDPRPRLNFSPYAERIKNILKKGAI